MKKSLPVFIGMAVLQGCTAILPPNTPAEFAKKLSDSTFGNVYTATTPLSYQDSVGNLVANMDACVQGVIQGSTIRSQNIVIGAGSGVWHYDITAASEDLTQFTLRREVMGWTGPQNEGGNIVAVINVEPQEDNGVSITGISPWGSAWLMEPIMAWGKGENPGCPIG